MPRERGGARVEAEEPAQVAGRELAEQRARNAVLAEQLARGAAPAGGADPETSGSIPDGAESSQVKAALEHAKAALEAELRAVKLELEESRAAATARRRASDGSPRRTTVWRLRFFATRRRTEPRVG